MIDRDDGLGRRILRSPALFSGEGHSPATLLSCLINQAKEINERNPSDFPNNRRNIREAIRQINLVLLFLEEIEETQLDLPLSVTLSFLELRMAFSKIHLLLEDCVRQGARLFILINSETISAKLHSLIRSISLAIEVLPLGWLPPSFSTEVKELLELVRKQSSRSKLQLELDDQKVVLKLHSMIIQLENNINPEFVDLKRVSDYLKIQSRSDCNREIEFLGNEIEADLLNSDKQELPLLGSLMGLVIYTRSVFFPSSDYKEMPSISESKWLTCVNQDELVCPISLQIMSDPVTISTGQTYDRSSLLQWFRMGNSTCPKTGNFVRTTELVPNRAILRIIRKIYGKREGSSTSKQSDLFEGMAKESLAARNAFQLIVEFLASKLALGTDEMIGEAACDIRLLGKRSRFVSSCIAEGGAIPLLLPLVCSANPLIQSNAMAAIVTLSRLPTGRAIIMDNNGLQRALGVLRNGLSDRAKRYAAATLYYLASEREYNRWIGQAPGTIPQLTVLVRDGAHCCRKNALLALYRLATYEGNQCSILVAGAVPVLVSILANEIHLKTIILAVLSILARSSAGAEVILNCVDPKLIARSMDSSETVVENAHCVSLLLSLCVNGGKDVISALARDESLMSSLYSQLAEGYPQARSNASSLIKMLHSFYEERATTLPNSPSVEQYIHVDS